VAGGWFVLLSIYFNPAGYLCYNRGYWYLKLLLYKFKVHVLIWCLFQAQLTWQSSSLKSEFLGTLLLEQYRPLEKLTWPSIKHFKHL
jgi:hypothetical protein